jgi:hypothetical protein
MWITRRKKFNKFWVFFNENRAIGRARAFFELIFELNFLKNFGISLLRAQAREVFWVFKGDFFNAFLRR